VTLRMPKAASTHEMCNDTVRKTPSGGALRDFKQF
jgi:hypothetical protein